jgi:hypothetical protein
MGGRESNMVAGYRVMITIAQVARGSASRVRSEAQLWSNQQWRWIVRKLTKKVSQF